MLNSCVSRAAVVLICFIVAMLSGNVSASEISDSIAAKFAFERSRSLVNTSYRDNEYESMRFINKIREINNDSTIVIRTIEIVSFASPDGSPLFNYNLAKRRGVNTASYLQGMIPELPDSVYRVISGNVNWNDLYAMVESSDMSGRFEILDILRNVPETTVSNGIVVPVRLNRLKRLRGGEPYLFMYTNYFSQLLNTAARVKCIYDKLDNLRQADLSDISDRQPAADADSNSRTIGAATDSLLLDSNESSLSEEWRRNVYIKSNLPAWLCLWINIAGEIDLAPHWSLNLAVYYSGWDYFRRSLKFRTTSVMPEIRYWFKGKNDVFFVGLHPGLAYYNVATEGEYRYQDHNGTTPAIGGGASVGFRFAVPQNPRWKFEASVGGGIYHLDYDMFENVDNGLLVGRCRRTFYGLDHVAFSVCYTFDITPGKGDNKSKKGDLGE